jgi:hypothetical protein
LLREGTDTSQGKGQLLSNIGACVAVVDAIRTTLGPRGMDKMVYDDKGNNTISNDGATILKVRVRAGGAGSTRRAATRLTHRADTTPMPATLSDSGPLVHPTARGVVSPAYGCRQPP